MSCAPISPREKVVGIAVRAAGLAAALIGLACAADEPPRSPEDIAAGEKLFVSACSGCHGKTGEGGRGPNLNDGKLVRRLNDQRLFSAIKAGVPSSVCRRSRDWRRENLADRGLFAEPQRSCFPPTCRVTPGWDARCSSAKAGVRNAMQYAGRGAFRVRISAMEAPAGA